MDHRCAECYRDRIIDCVPGSYPEICVMCAATIVERERIAAVIGSEAEDQAHDAVREAFLRLAEQIRGGMR